MELLPLAWSFCLRGCNVMIPGRDEDVVPKRVGALGGDAPKRKTPTTVGENPMM